MSMYVLVEFSCLSSADFGAFTALEPGLVADRTWSPNRFQWSILLDPFSLSGVAIGLPRSVGIFQKFCPKDRIPFRTNGFIWGLQRVEIVSWIIVVCNGM